MTVPLSVPPMPLHIPGLSPLETTRLRRSALLANLEAGSQDALLRAGGVIAKRKGEFLFMEGDRTAEVFYLLVGKAREYFTNADGEECLRTIFSPGRFVSLHLVFAEAADYSYSCEALTPLKCFAWRRKTLRELIQGDPPLACATARVLAGYMEMSCRHACLCRKTQAVSRVAGYLLSQYRGLCCPMNRTCPLDRIPTTLNLRPMALTANELCLARETFSRALSQLQRNNLIRISQGEVELIDIGRLKQVSGIADE